MPTLVVIDMQPKFEAATYRRCCRGVREAVVRAKKRGDHIIFVEYAKQWYEEYSQPTLEKITRVVNDYHNFSIVEKNDDDGSADILDLAAERSLDLSEIRVCGVNGSACVKRTVNGLLEKLEDAKIILIRSAIAVPKEWYNYHDPLNWVSQWDHLQIEDKPYENCS